MCGFVLKVESNASFQNGLLQHRGPDEQYIHEEQDWRIEYNRLAITGIVDGHSPARSKGNRFSVFLNGEIYNFRDLQNRFQLPYSNSDSVTLANLVELEGIEAIQHIRGMYAIVLQDLHEGVLYVVRDPLGEKPLFYSYHHNSLVFASEFRAVLKILGGSIHLNQKAIHDYLRFNYVEEPNTFDVRVKAFPKGSLVRIDPAQKVMRFIRQLDGYSAHDIDMPLHDLVDTVLDEAITTEVPSALSLSSGVDSTSILVRKMMQSDDNFSAITLHTGHDFNSSELIEVKSNAQALDAPLNIVDTHDYFFPSIVEHLIKAMDQPICDPSAVNYYLIFQRAQELSKKVVLLGQGPDEFFWGYSHYYKLIARIREQQIGLDNSIFLDVPQRSRRLLACLSPSEGDHQRTLNSSDDFLNSNSEWEILRANMVHGYLTHNGFAQIDRLSMHFSIEARSPLADSRIYGWAQNKSKKSFDAFEKQEFKNAILLGSLDFVKAKPKSGFKSDINSVIGDKSVSNLIDDAHETLFRSGLIDWRLTYPKILLTNNEKWKILVLGSWLRSLGDS